MIEQYNGPALILTMVFITGKILSTYDLKTTVVFKKGCNWLISYALKLIFKSVKIN